MKVYFRQTGGFAAVFRGVQIDTQGDPGPEAAELERLVETSGILHLADCRVQGARCLHLYTFEIETASGKHVVTLDELSVPDSVKPLLEFLKERSGNLLPD